MGEPRKPKRVKKKEDIETKDQLGGAESSNLLSESCFRLQVNEAVVEQVASQLQGKCQVAVQEDNTEEVGEINCFQEETTLKSLWYDDKRAQWNTEITDEEASRLDVILKPQLEQWSELSNNSSDLPSKAKLTKAVGVANTEASVLSAGMNIMRRIGVKEKQVCLTTTIIRGANQIKLMALGMVPVTV